MDLCAAHPVFSLYNDRWPILTSVPLLPPAKFVLDDGERVGRDVLESVIWDRGIALRHGG